MPGRVNLRKINLFDTLKEVLLIYLGVILCSTFAISAVEDWTLFRSLWWTVVTTATVGYGDMYPKTTFGMVLGIALIVTSMVLNALLGALLAAKLIVNNDAWTHVEQEQVKNQLNEVLNLLREEKDER